MTLQEAIAEWKSKNPQLPEESAEEYEVRAADMGSLYLAMVQREAEENLRRELRRKYDTAMTILGQPVGTTAAQVRQAVVQHRTILVELIEILKDSGLILGND